MTEAAAEAAIQLGAATWGSQSNADFRFYYMGRTSGNTLSGNGKNEMFFRNTSSGGMVAETYWWADASNKLVDADIVFYDGGFQFFTGSSGCSGGLYLEDIAAHEFGHALGLGHSSNPTATMWPSASWCSTDWRTLASDDLAGVEALYPASGSGSGSSQNTAPSLTVSAPANNTSVTKGTAVTFTGSATDSQDGNLAYRITWSSNLVGQFGVGASVSAVLPVGTNVVTASVNDNAGVVTTAQITVNVSSSTSVVSLSANAYRLKNQPRVDLTWGGAATASVDVYRNGARVTTTANDGAWSDSPGRKARGTYSYKVCEAGSTTCSNTASIVF